MSQLPSIGCIVICYPSRSIDLRGVHHNGLAVAGMVIDITGQEVIGPDGRIVPVCEIQWWGGDLGQGHESMTEIDPVGRAAATTREGHWWWPPQTETVPSAQRYEITHSDGTVELAVSVSAARQAIATRHGRQLSEVVTLDHSSSCGADEYYDAWLAGCGDYAEPVATIAEVERSAR